MIDGASAGCEDRQIPALAKQRLDALSSFGRIREVVNAEFEKGLAFCDFFASMLDEFAGAWKAESNANPWQGGTWQHWAGSVSGYHAALRKNLVFNRNSSGNSQCPGFDGRRRTRKRDPGDRRRGNSGTGFSRRQYLTERDTETGSNGGSTSLRDLSGGAKRLLSSRLIIPQSQ